MTYKLLKYQDHTIKLDLDRKMILLTDLWRAAGSPPGMKPAVWRSNVSVARFAEYLRENLKVSNGYLEDFPDVFRTIQGGNNPQTWAHWQMALAYAQDLSPAFRAWCGEAVRAYMGGSAPSSSFDPKLLQTASGLRTLRQLERHLKRLVARKALTANAATDVLTRMFNQTLGLDLPVVAARRKATPLAEEAKPPAQEPSPVVESEAVPLQDAPEPAPEGAEYVHPGPGEVASTEPALPANTYTGNGAADAIDKLQQVNGVGLFTCWMERKGSKNADRNQRGREFCRIMRELKMHPGRTKEYEPPSVAVTERYAGIYPAKAVRTTETGEAGHGVRDVVLFHPPAVYLVRGHLLEEMGLGLNGQTMSPLSGTAPSYS